MNLKIENFYFKNGFKTIFGVDEAGRGPLAGPVVATSIVILKDQKPKNNNLKEIFKILKDSKALSNNQREKIFNLIKKTPEIKYAYSLVSEKTIDKINIEKATFLAMKTSIEKLKNKIQKNPNLILIDGNRKIPNLKYNQKTIVKGDSKVSIIALASVISKVVRDKKMVKLAKIYPQYKFEIHKGYPTKLHLKLLKKYGPSKIHRKSFKPVKLVSS